MVMNQLPIDTNHPAVRDYLSLVRLQVLTPLSLLLNIATATACALVANPSLAGIARFHPTSITPSAPAIAGYVGVIYLGQIGYCLLLVIANKRETKQAILKGVGFSIVFANLLMAFWAIAWVAQWFMLATVLQGLLLLCLLYSNIALLIYHPPVSSRPMDTALIHAPLRFFLILPLNILFAISLFLTLGLDFVPTPPDSLPRNDSSWHALAGFGIVFGTNALGLVVVAIRRDIVWCVAATWLDVSLWVARPKPPLVFIPAVTFTVLHPLVLVIALAHAHFYRKDSQISLPSTNSDHLYDNEIESGPREVNENWG